jgi:hypothetical protein
MELRFGYRENGSPAIISNTGKESEPVGYQGIAQFQVSPEKIYIAFGDYYNGSGLIKSGVIYRLIEQVEE